MNRQSLQALLDQKHDQFNTPDFIQEDPVQIPHLFDRKEDIEIAAFLTALIAWGRRDIILRSAHRMLEMMEMQPYAFVVEAEPGDWDVLADFVHRTFNGGDFQAIVRGLRAAYLHHGGLERIFSLGADQADVKPAIVHARTLLSQDPSFPPRSHKHLANPDKGSSAKRINMFLRWMVRSDKRGVDFGLWQGISSAQLICPLDVHTGNVARKLGLLQRSQNDWKAAAELTESLRSFCPEDPVRYDFSLFGLGVYDKF